MKRIRTYRVLIVLLRSTMLLASVWFGLSAAGVAQTDKAALCVQVQRTGSVPVAGYVFETYESTDVDGPACFRIYQGGKMVYQSPDDGSERYYLGQLADAQYKIPAVPDGTDLTGRGRPDMIVTSWSGGAHCCYTRYVFELSPALRLLQTIEDGDTEGHFESRGGKRAYDYLTWDLWSYWPGSFASSVQHKVILAWRGDALQLDLEAMRGPAPTPQEWTADLKAVDDAVKGDNDRETVGLALWGTTLHLIYTGHSDLAWKFVREANPDAMKGTNASLGDFCDMLQGDQYWPELRATMREMPRECQTVGPPAKE